MILREELFEKYSNGNEQPLIEVIKNYEDMAKRNLTLRYDSNAVDVVAGFLQNNDEVIRKQPQYIDILIDLIVKNDLVLFGYHMLSNLGKYSNDNAKNVERLKKLTRLNGLAGYNPDDYMLDLAFKYSNLKQFSLDDKLRMLVVGIEEELKIRPLVLSTLYSPARHIKTELENNKDMIVANHDRFIDIIIETEAVKFIGYILESFKEYSESYINDKESIGNLITRFAMVIAEKETVSQIRRLDGRIREIEEEMGISFPEAHNILAAAVEKTKDTSSKLSFLKQQQHHGSSLNECLTTSITGRIEELINSNNVEAALQFAEENLGRISRLQDEVLNNSVRRLMDFVISTNNPKYIYRLAKVTRGDSNLIGALIRLDNPAYLYLCAAKIDNISLADMYNIAACVRTSGYRC